MFQSEDPFYKRGSRESEFPPTEEGVDIRIDYGTRSVPTTFKRLVPLKARLQILTVPFKRDILLALLFNLLLTGKEISKQTPPLHYGQLSG